MRLCHAFTSTPFHAFESAGKLLNISRFWTAREKLLADWCNKCTRQLTRLNSGSFVCVLPNEAEASWVMNSSLLEEWFLVAGFDLNKMLWTEDEMM